MSEEEQSDLTWPRIILLGDSITQYSFDNMGWGSTIQDTFQRKVDVYNRGFSGYNTKMILAKRHQILNRQFMKNVVAVTLFLGANDAALPEEKPAQHVPIEEYEKNLGVLVDWIKSFGISSEKIIMITPPPVNEKALLEDIIKKGEGDKCTRTNENAQKYSIACMQVAKRKECRQVDLWSAMSEGSSPDVPSSYLSDGLHLSPEGNSFLAKLLEPHLHELTGDLPFVLPYWRDFTYDDDE